MFSWRSGNCQGVIPGNESVLRKWKCAAGGYSVVLWVLVCFVVFLLTCMSLLIQKSREFLNRHFKMKD